MAPPPPTHCPVLLCNWDNVSTDKWGMGLGDAPGDCLPSEGPLRDQGQLGSICTLVLSDGAVGLVKKGVAEYLSGRRGGWGEGFVRMLQNLKSTQWSKVTFPSLHAQMETGASSMC